MKISLILFLVIIFQLSFFLLPSSSQDSNLKTSENPNTGMIKFYFNPLFQMINSSYQLEKVIGRPVTGITDDGVGPVGRPNGGLTDSILDGTNNTSIDSYGRPGMGLSDSILDGTEGSSRSDYGRPAGGLSDPLLDGRE